MHVADGTTKPTRRISSHPQDRSLILLNVCVFFLAFFLESSCYQTLARHRINRLFFLFSFNDVETNFGASTLPVGYLHSQSSMSLFETGLRVLRTLKPSVRCLSEITFSDARRVEDCYLYQLAHAPQGLGLFRHVLLVSSPQDRYVPHHSARIQLAGMTLKKGSKRAAALRKMAGALLGPLLEKAAAAQAAAQQEAESVEGVPNQEPEPESEPEAMTKAEVRAVRGDDEDAGAIARRKRAAVTSLLRADVHFAPPLKRSISAMVGWDCARSQLFFFFFYVLKHPHLAAAPTLKESSSWRLGDW